MESNLVFLFAAVLVVWLGIFAYLTFLGGRLGALRRDVDALKRQGGPDGADGNGPAAD